MKVVLKSRADGAGMAIFAAGPPFLTIFCPLAYTGNKTGRGGSRMFVLELFFKSLFILGMAVCWALSMLVLSLMRCFCSRR